MATVTNNGPYFYGYLVKDDTLDKIEIDRSNLYEEISIFQSELKSYLADGWTVKKQVKDRIILEKQKEADEQLENDVWLIFKNMGFSEMNKDRNFKIKAGSSPKQIDVYAKDENNVFAIFCTTNSSINLKDEIRKLSDLKSDISLSVKGYYNKKFRVSFILVTKNIVWNETDEKLANTKDILFWKNDDLESYRILVEQLGYAAKYQMYGLLFPNRKTSEVGEIEIPAMRGGKKDKYYLFLIQPEKLFKIAYVHRREKGILKEVGKAYQRMVSKQRIEKIGKFIDDGNSFPNNIIINFNKKPIFNPNQKIEEVSGISYGTLKFPPYYGCAWIIDGQHRLYGYSKSKHASDPKHALPVVAFESLGVKEQANLFVNINQEQKAVNQNLLWELYPDIYEGSEDEGQQVLRTISLISQKLNSDESSVFFKHIQIPSISTEDKKETNLTLTNICDGIAENKLINKKDNLLFNENYNKTVDFATEVIKAYFEKISCSSNDWNTGELGLLRTNVGVRILFIVLRQLLIQLQHDGKVNIYKKRDLTEFKNEITNYLTMFIEKLSKLNGQEISDIISGSTRHLVMKNAQKLLWELKEATGFGFELWNNKKAWNPGVPGEETIKNILDLVDDTEVKLRSMIINILKSKYGDGWWRIGIPEGVKSNVDRSMEQEKSKFPWKREQFNSLPDEEKLKFSLTSDLSQIIVNGNNWADFETIFYKYKDCVLVQFSFFENFRNKYKHPERNLQLDEVERGLGYYGMGWIRKCMGLNPKKVA